MRKISMVLDIYSGRRRKKKSTSLLFSHKIQCIFFRALLHVFSKEWTLILYFIWRSIQVHCYFPVLLKTLLLIHYFFYYCMEEFCVCWSGIMFPSLIYLQILSVSRQALSLFLCQDTLQLNFLRIFFSWYSDKDVLQKLLHKDYFVYKLHSYVPVMKYSHPVTRQQPLVADTWLE